MDSNCDNGLVGHLVGVPPFSPAGGGLAGSSRSSDLVGRAKLHADGGVGGVGGDMFYSSS